VLWRESVLSVRAVVLQACETASKSICEAVSVISTSLASIQPMSLTSAADFGSTSPADSVVHCYSECVHSSVTSELPENVGVVDNNGNKLEVDGSSSVITTGTFKEFLPAAESEAGSSVPSSPVKLCSVTLTPLKQLMSSLASSPSRDSTSTPPKLLGSSVKSLTPVKSHVTPSKSTKSQVTPSKSPGSKAAKSKSPASVKSSTPSKSKLPTSSPRQRSLIEMFSRHTDASASVTSTETSPSVAESSDTQPATECFEDGQKLETSPPSEHRQLSVEVLVEDSQIGRTSPVQVVDTQESMFVDETPPNTKSSDFAVAAADVDGEDRSKATCDIVADSCDISADTSSLSGGDVSQPTVVHIDTDDDVTQTQVAMSVTQLAESSDGRVLAGTVNTECTSHSQASCTSDVFIVDSEIQLTANSVVYMSQDPTNNTQHNVDDHTQIDSLDHIQPSLDCTQFTVDHTQHDVLGGTEANNTKDETVVSTDAEDDVPLIKMTQSHDAEKFMSSDDDIPLTQLKAAKDDDNDNGLASSASSSQIGHHQRVRCDKTLDKDVRSRQRKDAVHMTIHGRVTRHFTETRPTRLNLRTRSVRRITDKLVTVGAKKVDRVPLQLPGVRQKGRPKKLKSDISDSSPEVANGQSELKTRSWLPRRSSSRRTRKSVWMQVAAVELDTAPSDGDRVLDLVKGTGQNSQAEGDVGRDFSEKNGDGAGMESSFENSDTINKIAELQTDVDGRIADEVRDLEEPAKMTCVDIERPNDDEVVEEEVKSNNDDTPATGGEMLESCGKPESGTDLDQETLFNEHNLVEPPVEMTDGELSYGGPAISEIVTEDITDNMLTVSANIDNTPASEYTSDKIEVPISVSSSSGDDDGTTDVDIISEKCDVEPITSGSDNNVGDTETQADVEKSTPDGDGECHWKIPISSVVRGQSATPADAPPETPTSIPRQRFTSRGSLMLERAKQLRQSATSPLQKSTSRFAKPAAVEASCEEEMAEQSPSTVGRYSSSGLSKLRVFSPAASPSAGILRKRQLSSDSAAASSGGQSPSSPSSRVSCLHLWWSCV